MKPKLLIAESTDFSAAALEMLQQRFDVALADLDRAGLIAALPGQEFLWVRLRTLIDDAVLKAGPDLQGLITNTTGLNHIDLAAAERRGLRVWSLRGETDFLREIRATSELTMGLALAVLRQIPAAHQHVLAGGWDRDLFRGRELNRRRIGLLGYGRLGQQVAELFRAFGAEVAVCDPALGPVSEIDGFPVHGCEALLRSSQLISVHASHRPNQPQLLTRERLELLPPGSVVINTARGELLDEAALADLLETGRLGGAGLDVRDSEHQPAANFQRLRELAARGFPIVLTPHCGGNTWESREQTELFLARRLCAELVSDQVSSV